MSEVKHKSDSDRELAPGKRRDVRRLAMQVLYQLDATAIGGTPDRQALLDGLDDEFDKLTVREQGVDWALAAWAGHESADRQVEAHSPDWPTHRQPPVDRAILRLAHYEMTSGLTPPKVAINEAVELAKQYGSEQSAAFVNGILDKLAKGLGESGGESVRDEREEKTPAEAGSAEADVWLDDAKEQSH